MARRDNQVGTSTIYIDFLMILRTCRRNLTSHIDSMRNTLSKIPYLNKQHLSFREILQNSHNVTYRGVVCRKFPLDYVVIQMIIHKVKPDLIIEIGTNHGGSALYLADLAATYNPNAEIHTIDVVDLVTDNAVLKNPRITRFMHGFQNYNLSNCAKFKNVMVIDDGSHLYQDVLAALRLFGPVVTSGSYFIVEDGGLSYMGWNRHYAGGPLRAINEFLSMERSMEVDQELTEFFGSSSTNNPKGYLRKI